MATELKIPQVGESIPSVFIAGFAVSVGDYVSAGDTVVEMPPPPYTHCKLFVVACRLGKITGCASAAELHRNLWKYIEINGFH